MSESSQREERKHPEFRRYRQALFAIYFAVLASGSLLLLASVVYDLFFRRGERASLPSPTDLIACQHDVRALLEDLGVTASKLQSEAVTGDPHDLGGRWERFSRDWQERWTKVGERCRFDELADTGLGPAYDRMAWVHRQLPPMKLKYRELMKRFTVEQASDLEEMRRALDRSRAVLEPRGRKDP